MPADSNRAIAGLVVGCQAAVITLVERLDREGLVSRDDYAQDLRRILESLGAEASSEAYALVLERIADALSEPPPERQSPDELRRLLRVIDGTPSRST